MRWLERAAAPWMVRATSPTADLYFLNACKDMVGQGRSVSQIAPGVFASHDAALVIRHAGGGAGLPDRPRLFYLVDDDVDAIVGDRGAPIGQRAKLALFERRHRTALLAREAQVIVSSQALAQVLAARGRRASVLGPHWSEPLAWPERRRGSAVRLGFLASAVHRRDADFLLPVLDRILAIRPGAELHVAANHRLGRLRRHPQVRLITATDWRGYRNWLARARLDIALYPLLPGPVNRARSVNKLIEHALTGAATLCSADWPEAERVARRGAGIVLGADPRAWERAILDLIDEPEQTYALAMAGRRLAADLNRPDRQRIFWRHAFSLDGAVAPSSRI